jgi:hypothetical protein
MRRIMRIIFYFIFTLAGILKVIKLIIVFFSLITIMHEHFIQINYFNNCPPMRWVSVVSQMRLILLLFKYRMPRGWYWHPRWLLLHFFVFNFLCSSFVPYDFSKTVFKLSRINNIYITIKSIYIFDHSMLHFPKSCVVPRGLVTHHSWSVVLRSARVWWARIRGTLQYL